MQVERNPSRWPYVALLVGLLIACLLAPQYWHAAEAPERTTNAKRMPGTSSSQPFDRSAGRAAAQFPAFGLTATPTIDDLISTLNVRVAMPRYAGMPASEWPLAPNSPPVLFDITPPAATHWSNLQFAPRSEVPDVPGALATAVLRHIGTVAAVYSRLEIGRWLGEAISQYWVELARDHFVIEPVIGPAAPNFPTLETSSPASAWTVPDVLIQQLARLAQDPYSRRWATGTIIQLDALLQLDRANGDTTSARLARLAAAADEAVQLADAADDDRLRVELLRAHWGLARRIDRWAATNDIRVAALSQARVAARGELGSILNHVPDRSDVDSLSADLETYERTRDPQLGRQIVHSQLALQSSPDALDRSLADAVEEHYRNANVRLAVTNEMLNRFVAGEQNEWQPVRDRIAGTPVRGQSETLSESRLALQPATGRWQLDIEADGVVHSNTLADGGRARLRSFGATDFTAQKTVVVDTNGVRMEPAVVTANNHNHLAGVTTDFDWVPLFGSYARGRAVDQYRAKRGQAKAEVEWKVASQAGDRLDERATEAVDRAEREVRDRITGPLSDAGIALTPIELTTTSQRLVARLRVAGDGELAAHTPRPRAPSDSLASVQVHESALTNAAVSLGLDGRRFAAPELQATLREKLPQLAADNPPEAHDDTAFHFADRDAVRFHIENGRLDIALALVDFQRDGRHVRDFVVHAYYVPVVSGLSAELVRDGALGIEGRLSAGDRARLHSVFKEVLGPERRLPVVQLDEPTNDELAGLMITQLVLEDGWIGLAIGPQTSDRTAERSRSLR